MPDTSHDAHFSHGLRLAAAGVAACCLLALGGCDFWVSPDTRVQRAAEHISKAQYGPAVRELKTALEKDPNNGAARLALAELQLWLGDIESADKEAQRAAAAGADAARTKKVQYEVLLAHRDFDGLAKALAADSALPATRRGVLEARAAAAQGLYEEADAKVKSALQQDPNDPEALLESARLAASRGQLEPALELPSRLTQAPADIRASAVVVRGLALLNRGEHEEARKVLNEALADARNLRVTEQLTAAVALTEANLALKDATAAERSLAKIVRWRSESVVAQYFRAQIAMLRNDYAAAVAECQRALRIDPQNVQSQMLLAAAHVAQGSHEQAEDVLTRLVNADPDNVTARKLLAQLYLGRNEPGKAQRLLAADGSSAEDADLEWLRGTALIRSGSLEDGLEQLERSVAAKPADEGRRVDLAAAYIAAGRVNQATQLLATVPASSPVATRARALQVIAVASGKPRDKARAEVEGLLAKNPNDAALATTAGAFLVGIQEAAAGRTVLLRAVELDPKSVDAHFALARAESAMRNPSQAQSHYEQILKLDPAHQGARLGLADLAWGRGDRDAARQQLEAAISADPSAIEARLRLARIAFLQGDPKRARGLLDQVLQVAPDRQTALTATGLVLSQAGLSEEALARFREAGAAGDSRAILYAARLHLELNQPEKARELIEPALKAKPDWREAEQVLVMIDARSGNLERAQERAKKLAGNVPPAVLRAIEGDVALLARKVDVAIEAYEASQRLQPTAAVAVKLFNARRSAGIADAQRSLTAWLAREPEDHEVRRLLAGYYESVGQTQLAMQEYERLLAANRIDPVMLNNMAWSLHERGDARALDLAKRAYAAAPGYPEISDTYGWILVRMDRITEGLPVLEQALAKAPANPDVQYHAAFAYVKTGQPQRAEELLRKALATSQPFASREAAERLLKSVASAAG
jgi:putative PEP-CTERM system TPR-repeat lipoprotein